LTLSQAVADAAVDNELVVRTANRSCDDISLNKIRTFQSGSVAQSRQLINFSAFLMQPLYNVGKMVSELVIFAAADPVCGRLTGVRRKHNASANA